MDDLTDDLLALAGDGDEVTGSPSPTKPASPLPRHASTPPQRSTPSQSQPQKGVARKMNKRAKSNATRTPLQLQEDEP